jgi:imidazolonepropionase-like amidohydrolase
MSRAWSVLFVVLLVAGGPARAQPAATTTALVNARLYTLQQEGPLENATVVIRDGKVQAVGAGLSPPAGARVIDVEGRIVTPGLMSAGSQLGLVEVGSLADTRDHSVATGALGAAFDVQYALNPNATSLDLALSDGLTRALAHPEGSAVAPFLGQAALLRLGSAEALLERARVAMFVRVAGDAAAGVGGSRGASWSLLRNALEEARRYRPSSGAGSPRDQLLGRLDAEALQDVVQGRMPLAIVADRESDLRQVLRLHDDTRLPLVVYGGAEAWRVAPELAARRIPVVLDPTLNLPASFDALGARLDNAARLHAAGVSIAFSPSAFFRTYNAGSALRLGAGLAVANGLPWIEGLRAMTATPASIFGLDQRYGTVRPDVDADLVVWDGDPLEPATSALHVWVRGVEVPVDRTRQRALAERYSPLRKGEMPPAYRR